MGHVQIDRPGIVVVLENFAQLLEEEWEIWILNILPHASYPSRAADHRDNANELREPHMTLP